MIIRIPSFRDVVEDRIICLQADCHLVLFAFRFRGGIVLVLSLYSTST